MKISSRGLDMIKEFEGYHRALPDGSCIPYRCPAGVLTIGYGCTESVREGMRWTKADAEARLLGELEKHEAAVQRYSTTDLNQNQFDALVSFSYNLGTEALRQSTLLKKVNAGQWEAAGQEFGRWTKAAGKVLPGLVARRGKEAALFLEPISAAIEPEMPQKLDQPADTTPNPLHKSGTIWGAITAAFATLIHYLDEGTKAVIEWVGAIGDLEPVRETAMKIGGNAKAIGLGLTVAGIGIVVSRRVKAHNEGKAG
jgi:lysozyme